MKPPSWLLSVFTDFQYPGPDAKRARRWKVDLHDYANKPDREYVFIRDRPVSTISQTRDMTRLLYVIVPKDGEQLEIMWARSDADPSSRRSPIAGYPVAYENEEGLRRLIALLEDDGRWPENGFPTTA